MTTISMKNQNNVNISVDQQPINNDGNAFGLSNAKSVKANQSGRQLVNCVGSVIKGTITGVGKNASVTIGNHSIGVDESVVAGRKIGDELQFKVEKADAKQVSLKVMHEFANIADRDGKNGALASLSQVQVQRSTDQFVSILSDSDLSVEVTKEVADDAHSAAKLSADDLQMLRQMGIDVSNADLSHLMGLVNQYHAQQEGRTFQTGSAQVAQAIAIAQNIDAVSEGARRYLLANDMDFTYANAYKAEYSAVANCQSEELSEEEWKQLLPQVDSMLSGQQIAVDDATRAAAKWMIEQGIDITVKSMDVYQQISNFNENGLQTEQYEKNIIETLSAGLEVQDAPIAGQSDMAKAQEIVAELSNVDKETVDYVVSKDMVVNLRNLFAVQKDIAVYMSETGTNMEQNSKNQDKSSDHLADSANENKAQQEFIKLQEIRLRMTVSSGYQLVKNGIDVQSLKLDDVLKQLDALEQANVEGLFRDSRVAVTSENVSLYQQTMTVTQTIPYLPAATLGVVKEQQSSETLNVIYRTGLSVAASFSQYRSVTATEQENDNETFSQNSQLHRNRVQEYETLMTRPRSDMGDTMREAFSRMDSLLQENGIEVNERNRKAVRILAYNQMEISAERVEQIATLDDRLMSVLKQMTPENVLGMIRDGVNPLTMNMDELYDELQHQQEKHGEGSQEKFSRFLCKLEKSGEISEEERKSYIGIYRLLHTVTSYSDRDLGSVIQNGQDMTLNNLLSAHRSRKQQGREFAVDDDFGMFEQGAPKGESISQQIQAAYEKEKVAFVNQIDEETMEAEDAEIALQKEQFEKLSEVTEDGVRLLQKTEQPFTPAMLTAAQDILQQTADFYQTVQKQFRPALSSDDVEFEQIENAIFSHMDNMDAKRGIQVDGAISNQNQDVQTDNAQGVEQMTTNPNESENVENTKSEATMETSEFWLANAFANRVYEAGEEYVFTGKDVMSNQQIHTSMRVAQALSEQENYLIPLVVGQELMTMNVVFEKQEDANPGFVADIPTRTFGKVHAEFNMLNDDAALTLSCENEINQEQVQYLCDAMKKAVEKAGVEDCDVQMQDGATATAMQHFLSENSTPVASKTLYAVAKQVVAMMKQIEA